MIVASLVVLLVESQLSVNLLFFGAVMILGEYFRFEYFRMIHNHVELMLVRVMLQFIKHSLHVFLSFNVLALFQSLIFLDNLFKQNIRVTKYLKLLYLFAFCRSFRAFVETFDKIRVYPEVRFEFTTEVTCSTLFPYVAPLSLRARPAAFTSTSTHVSHTMVVKALDQTISLVRLQ